jgi:phosphoribosylformylglycinamidine synthase subunit PurL
VQDLGAAGVTGATSESTSKGGSGIDIDVRAIHLREPGMEPWEIMISESQERMLAIVTPDNLDELLQVCEKWEVHASVIGRVNSSGRYRVLDGPDGEVLADMPADSLDEDAPVYDRPLRRPDDLDEIQDRDPDALPSADSSRELLELLVDPSWVYRQYDHQLFLNTVVAPGGDAAVLRLKAPGLPPTRRGLAVSTDGNARWCALDPRLGTAMVVAEAALNVACVGARPVASVNCMNFGNPEHPEVMWQFSESIDGMGEACRVLDVPVVGGNVSLYNETRGRNIDPTPVVAVLGLIDSLERRPPGVRLVDGGRLLLLGRTEATLAGTRWAQQIHGFTGGRLPALDLVAHRDLIDAIRSLVDGGLVDGVHDVSEGGLGVALAEMAVNSDVGFFLASDVVDDHRELFSESPSRVVVCVDPDNLEEVARRLDAADVPFSELGIAQGDRLVIDGLVDVSLADAKAAYQGAIPNALTPAIHD